jgi:fermentation-respiration switch protein FrsA (DUF1100 family)
MNQRHEITVGARGRAGRLLIFAVALAIGWLGGVPGQARVAAAASRDGTPEVFDYEAPVRLEIAEQGEVKEGGIAGTRQYELRFRNLRGEPVPVLITLPEKGKGPFPAVLLVHALGGDRRQITREMGKALAARGFACAALDLPLHGDRAGEVKPEELVASDDGAKAYRNIVGSITDIRQTLDALKTRKDLDVEKGVPVIGYSLGAWFGTLAGSADRRVSMLVLQGAGAGEQDGSTKVSGGGGLFGGLRSEKTLLDRYPTVRPEIAAAEFAPRPLLMQNGKKDPFIPEDAARSLYRAARAPKELKWYDSGHVMPEKAITDAVEWIAKNR